MAGAAGLVAAAMAAGGTAEAQQACGAREMVLKRLAEGYGESRRSVGLGANNAVIEVFASDETGTWTITVTMPNGTTCLVASGQAFESTAGDLAPASETDA
jgi:hypothetical protein